MSRWIASVLTVSALTLEALPAQTARPQKDVKNAPAVDAKTTEPVLLPTESRTLTSADGRTIQARVLAVDHAGKTVDLRLGEGKEMKGLPFSRFSKEDQQFFALCRVQSAPKNGVTEVDNEDPEMVAAMAEARKTFPEAWKKIRADRQAEEPRFDQALIKAAFSDDGSPDDVEQMWIGDFTFDGRLIRGRLLSRPARLKSVREGEEVRIPLENLSDWTFQDGTRIHGAFTEKLLHRRMSPEERLRHNEATGIDWDQALKD